MAKEWYLLDTPYNQISGYEEDDYSYSAQSAFAEALQTSLADTVELCNYDLTERRKIRAIIQGSVQDTKLNALSRRMLVPLNTCKAGMYVYYKGRYWLIVGLADDNTMYEKAVMMICNYLLTWQNSSGTILQRWANVTSASQYNNGETSTEYFWTRSDQLLVLISDDDESLLITNGQRFIIDRRTSVYEKNFDSDVKVDTSNPVVTYKVTRADTVLYNYIDSGHQELMVKQDDQQPDDGYYNGYWLCGVPDMDDDLSMAVKILCDSDSIYNDMEAGVFTAKFYGADGNEIDVTPKWDIDCPFKDELKTETLDNTIFITVRNKGLVNRTFVLTASADGYESASLTVTIKAFI